MAYDYNRAKQVWDSMNDQQKKQYTEQNKNDANFQQFAQQYHEEKQQTAPRQVQANVNVDNLQNNQPQKQQQVINTQTESEQQPLAQKDSNGMYTGNSEWEKEQNRRMLEEQKKQAETIKNNIVEPSSEFDSSRLTNPNAEVSVKEGKAAQTGTPDYEEDSEARMNEITNNLNAYWNNNKSYFSDRATFNSTFHYDDRSDKQKALLDSFWKGTQDQVKANSYHNGDEIMSGFENGEITPDIMSYLRTYNEAAYDEWQKKMEDKVNTLIANMAAPRDVWDTAELWQNIVKKFGLEAGDPYDIYGEWYRMSEELGVFRDSQQLASMSNNIASIYSTMNSNVQSISSQLEGRYSAGYIAARIDKANSKLNSQAQSMQYSYNLLLQNRNQNMAIAQQAAAMKQAQGQEDSRIFNQKLAGLGFAMTADSYRTPEQQAQLQLQTQSILNDINLINQGNRDQLDLYKQRQLNQLEITHMHDLAEAQDQINFERTDLTVENEGLLRKNLSNVLDEYYSKFGDMIQRPKSQVIEDVLAYAREHNVSVAEALKKDFIEPLQGKTEYQNMLAKNYANPYQTTWNYSIGDDGKLSVDVKGVGNLNLNEAQKQALLANKKTYSDSGMKGAGLRNNNPGNIKDTGFGNVLGTDAKGFAIFMTPEDGFDALVEKIQNIQKGGSKTYSSNMSLYDFFAKYAPSSDNNNPKAYAESVAKQLGTTANATVGSVNATKFAAAIAKHDSGYDASTYGNFRNASTYSDVGVTTNTDTYNANPYQSTMGTTSTGAEINSGGWITSLEKTFGSTQRMSDAERKELYESYGIDKKTYDKMEYNYARYTEKTEGLQALKDSLTRAESLLQWNKDNQGLHEGWADIETAENGYYKFGPFQGVTKASEGRAIFDELKNNEVLNKFLDLKKNNASFGAMSEGEWSIIGGATSQLKWNMTDANFEKTLENLIKTYKDNIEKIDPNYFKTPNEIKTEEASVFGEDAVMTGVNNNLSGAVSFIIG